MKNPKLKLDALKVKTFVTTHELQNLETVKGGIAQGNGRNDAKPHDWTIVSCPLRRDHDWTIIACEVNDREKSPL